MSNDKQTGITGNSPAQMSAGAAAEATTIRGKNKKSSLSTATNVGIGLFVLIGFIILNVYGISFVWQIILAIGLIWSSKLLQKKPDMSWASFAKYAGWAVLAVALLSSSFGQWATKKIDAAEAKFSSNVRSSGTPSGSCTIEGVMTPLESAVPVTMRHGGCVVLMNGDALDDNDVPIQDIVKSGAAFDGLGTDDFIVSKSWVHHKGTSYYKLELNDDLLSQFPDGVPLKVYFRRVD